MVGRDQRKEGHHVVDTGPYALVRHPIYTGLIVATLATAAAQATVTGLIGAVLIALGLWLKARTEETLPATELGADVMALTAGASRCWCRSYRVVRPNRLSDSANRGGRDDAAGGDDDPPAVLTLDPLDSADAGKEAAGADLENAAITGRNQSPAVLERPARSSHR